MTIVDLKKKKKKKQIFATKLVWKTLLGAENLVKLIKF